MKRQAKKPVKSVKLTKVKTKIKTKIHALVALFPPVEPYWV